MPKSEPLVAAVLLNWNTLAHTRACIRSLRAGTYSNLYIVVVDNGSIDGSPDSIAAEFPSVRLVRLPRNAGYGAGNNAGIAEALRTGADCILILNNDTITDRGLVGHLVAALKSDPRIGMAAPKIYYLDSPKEIWYAGARLNLWTASTDHRGFGSEDTGAYEIAEETAFASGCCFLMSRSLAASLGGFDESYFAYYEDADLSYRCRRAGYKIVYEPRAVLWHKESGSLRESGRGLQADTALQFYLKTRNGFLFFGRHGTTLQRLLSHVILLMRTSKQCIRFLRLGQCHFVRLLLRACADGIAGKSGAPEIALRWK